MKMPLTSIESSPAIRYNTVLCKGILSWRFTNLLRSGNEEILTIAKEEEINNYLKLNRDSWADQSSLF